MSRSQKWIEDQCERFDRGDACFGLDSAALSAVLVDVCNRIEEVAAIGGEFDWSKTLPATKQWHDDFIDVQQARKRIVRERALAKLSEEERAALKGWL